MMGELEAAPLRRSWRERLSAPQLLVLSFAVLITIGTLGFLTLPGLYTGERLGVVDALFMATSAVCVTGLSVVNISRHFTVWGQAWLLLLVQAGGLGILTLAAVVVAAVGRRSSLAVEQAAGEPAAVLPSSDPIRLLRAALVVTVVVEALGAAVLWTAWTPRFGAGESVWLAVFHSISAFCNAGFSLFSEGFVVSQRAPLPLFGMAALIVVGGLGFPVIQDLRLRAAGRHERLTLHSRLVLGTTALLVVVSALLFFAFESRQTLAELGPLDRAANALFMAVTPRTAGFHTVDYDHVTNPSLFLTIALMWIGGGPASTAGGVKVTTAALLGLILWSRLRGETHVSAFGRTVSEETVQRATGLAVGGTLLLSGFVFLLLTSELPAAGEQVDRLQLVRLLFEVQSALSTVGLSMGITTDLTPAGRLIIVSVMLLGRVGPLAALGAMALRQQRRVPFRYAREDVIVG